MSQDKGGRVEKGRSQRGGSAGFRPGGGGERARGGAGARARRIFFCLGEFSFRMLYILKGGVRSPPGGRRETPLKYT